MPIPQLGPHVHLWSSLPLISLFTPKPLPGSNRCPSDWAKSPISLPGLREGKAPVKPLTPPLPSTEGEVPKPASELGTSGSLPERLDSPTVNHPDTELAGTRLPKEGPMAWVASFSAATPSCLAHLVDRMWGATEGLSPKCSRGP